jgi:hypothetical protein
MRGNKKVGREGAIEQGVQKDQWVEKFLCVREVKWVHNGAVQGDGNWRFYDSSVLWSGFDWHDGVVQCYWVKSMMIFSCLYREYIEWMKLKMIGWNRLFEIECNNLNLREKMIYRRPTVINIKAEEDMQDVQPIMKQSSSIMTPTNNIRGRNQDFRNQMELERVSLQGQSPYTSELFGSYLRNDTSNDDIWAVHFLFLFSIWSFSLNKLWINHIGLIYPFC